MNTRAGETPETERAQAPAPPSMAPLGLSARAQMGLVLALAVLPHLGALAGRPTQDDFDFIIRNESIRSFGAALAAFSAPFPAGDPGRGLYRPLTNLSYAVDYALGGSIHHGVYLASNVALYAVGCALALRLFRRALGEGGGRAALLAAGLFALHPVHTEVVDSASGRSELLALLFGALALWWQPRRPAAALGAVVLAMLSKETGVIFTALLGVAALVAWPEPAPLRRRLPPALLALALVPVYLGVRAAALGRLTPATTTLAGLSAADRLWTLGRVHLENLRLMLWPAGLQPDACYMARVGVQQGPTAAAVLGLVAGALTVGAALLAARRAWGGDRRAGAVALGLAIWLGTLFPTSHAVPIGALMAERFLFSPSLGLLLALAVGLAALRGRAAEGAQALGLLAMVAFAAGTSARALEWADPVRLWASAAERCASPVVYANLGEAELEAGDLESARRSLESALALDPQSPFALGSLASLARMRGDVATAEALLLRLTQLHPEEKVAWNNLGALYLAGARWEEAETCLSRALALDPNYATAARNLDAVRRRVAP